MTRRSPVAPSPRPGSRQPLRLSGHGYRRALLHSTSLDPSRAPGLAVMALLLVFAAPAMANPSGGQVVGGQAAIVATDPKTLQVTQGSDKAIIDWRSFSIGADETTRFVQPSSSSIILNRVTGGDPSRIFGTLTANGQVMLINGSGILFGATAKIDVAGLIASTADIRNSDFMAGRMNFDLPGRADAAVVNKGDITVADSGLVAFVAPGVENAGRINAKLGRVALASGERFAVDLYGDGLVSLAVGPSQSAVDADGRVLSAAVANSGSIIADGGFVTLSAAAASAIVDNVINSDGLIQARRIDGQGGEIVLDGGANGLVRVAGQLDATSPDGAGGKIKVLGERVELADGARLDASGATGGGTILAGGNWQGKGPERNARQTTVAAGATLKADAGASGNGGTVVVWADESAQFAGAISARGGAAGGNGGQVETSGKQSLAVAAGATVDAGAAAGEGGRWLLDPDSLTIADGGGGSLGGAGAQTVDASVIETTLRGGTGVTLQATNAITVNEAIDGSGGASGAGSDLALNTATVNLNAAITLHAAATLSGTAVTVNVGSAGRIQNGIDVAATGADVNVAAGSYGAGTGINVNKAGLSLRGAAGAKIVVPDSAQVNGININADNVRVEGFEIAGPATSSYLTYNWGSNISRGIAVANGADNFVIANNDIHDLRTGILIDGRNANSSVTGNRIENTKSGISVQYTDAAGIAISGNSQGAFGNEWGVNLHLNGYWNGTTTQSNPIAAAPSASWQQALLGLSATNAGWSVQDQGYSSSNRTHVNVATTGSSSAQGSALAPLNSIQNGINAVVAGGKVNVAAGTYHETVSIGKALTLDGAGIGQTVLQANVAGVGDAITIANASNVTLSDLTISDYLYGLRMTGTSHDATVARVAFEDNTYGMRNGTGTRADRFHMEDSSFSGGLIAVQTYIGTGGNGSFSDALFDNVSIDGATFKGFYLETANNLTLRDVTITNSGNVGGEDPSQFHKYGHAVDINLKYDDYNALTFDNLVVLNSGYSSGDATRGAVVIKTRGIAGDSTSYVNDPASLQSVNFIGGRIEGAQGTGLRVETLRDGAGGQPTVALGGGMQFANNGQDIVVDATRVDATGAVFVGAADGFAVENRVTHAMDGTARGLVTWDANNLYVTTGTLGIQRGIAVAGAGDTVNVAAGSYAEAINLDKNVTLRSTGATVSDLDSTAGASVGLAGQWTVQDDATFAGAVTLAGDLTLDTHAVNGDIAFLGAVTGQAPGGQDLALNAGSGTVTMHNLGTSSVKIGDVSVQAGSYAGSAGTAYVANFDVTAGDVAVGNSTVNASGNVTLSGTNVSGSIVAATATIAATGNVASNVATTSSASVSGANVQGSVSGANVTVAATQTSSATVAATNTASVSGANVQGSVSGANVTVAATQTSSANVAATNTASVSGANVQGTVSGANVTVAATETANTTVVASNSASVSGSNVQGSVQAPTATVTATQTVNIQVDTDTLTVSAPSGSVSGDPGTVHVTGSGVLEVNNETTTSVDNNVGRASGVLDPNAVLAPEIVAPVAMSPSSLAFAGGAGDVFAYGFSLGAAPIGIQPAAGGAPEGNGQSSSDGQSVPALDSGDASVAAYFGDFWSYFASRDEE